jgi:hypothetical protein
MTTLTMHLATRVRSRPFGVMRGHSPPQKLCGAESASWDVFPV